MLSLKQQLPWVFLHWLMTTMQCNTYVCDSLALLLGRLGGCTVVKTCTNVAMWLAHAERVAGDAAGAAVGHAGRGALTLNPNQGFCIHVE